MHVHTAVRSLLKMRKVHPNEHADYVHLVVKFGAKNSSTTAVPNASVDILRQHNPAIHANNNKGGESKHKPTHRSKKKVGVLIKNM